MKTNLLIPYTFLLAALPFCQAQTCDVYTANNSSLTTHGDSNVSFFGNLENDGNFQEMGGTIRFINESESLSITGENHPNFFELIVDVPNDLFIDNTANIYLNTEFSRGRILTPREYSDTSLHFSGTDLYTFEHDKRHIDGYASYTGEAAFNFPIGDEMRLRGLSLPAGVSITTSKAAYFYEDPNSPSTFTSFDTSTINDDVALVSNSEFWDLDGSLPTTVTLTWDDFSNFSLLFPDDDISQLTIVGWSLLNQRWENLGKTNVSETERSITSSFFIPSDYEALTFGREASDIDDRLEIFNGVFPDNTNVSPNSFFRIRGINSFPRNHLKIFNRWGVLVYEKEGYTDPGDNQEYNPNEVFVGIANRSGRLVSRSSGLPDGTYFYILTLVSDLFGEQQRTGYLYLSGEQDQND